MAKNSGKNDEWLVFEHEILDVAATFAELKKDAFDHAPPKNVIRDLRILDKALTVTLQAIAPLQLEHQEGQDIITSPFNWPTVVELSHARVSMNAKRDKLIDEIPTYPSGLISGLRELRDAARFSIALMKPRPGNSGRRNSSSARMADLAKNFVFRFRCRFGYMPPMSKTGREVELLQTMFEIAGEVSTDAAEQLRQAIEKDTVGRELLKSARIGKISRRAK